MEVNYHTRRRGATQFNYGTTPSADLRCQVDSGYLLNRRSPPLLSRGAGLRWACRSPTKNLLPTIKPNDADTVHHHQRPAPGHSQMGAVGARGRARETTLRSGRGRPCDLKHNCSCFEAIRFLKRWAKMALQMPKAKKSSIFLRHNVSSALCGILVEAGKSFTRQSRLVH